MTKRFVLSCPHRNSVLSHSRPFRLSERRCHHLFVCHDAGYRPENPSNEVISIDPFLWVTSVAQVKHSRQNQAEEIDNQVNLKYYFVAASHLRRGLARSLAMDKDGMAT